jgi:hypothetical protein
MNERFFVPFFLLPLIFNGTKVMDIFDCAKKNRQKI